ncbi:hypothetical protein ACIXN2_16855 [Bacteroides fragilis]
MTSFSHSPGLAECALQVASNEQSLYFYSSVTVKVDSNTGKKFYDYFGNYNL